MSTELEKPKRKMVSISNETMGLLAKERNGFETPDQCMNRILSECVCPNPKTDQDKDPEEGERS